MTNTLPIAAYKTLPDFAVKNGGRNELKLIPYVGCKAGFKHVFDEVIPPDVKGQIVDVFGGGGSFTFYASQRFGSHRVTYNDNNPVLVNLLHWLQTDPEELWNLYQTHYERSSPDYYYELREEPLDVGMEGAARFLYLAKNAFSGKIRFNQKNQFNSPIRKGSKCPQIQLERMMYLSKLIRDVSITNKDYRSFENAENLFLYLDPPYFNNTNGHYNGVLDLDQFKQFIQTTASNNSVLLSEQNDPVIFGLNNQFTVRTVHLKRSLQYFTQSDSHEIVAYNY